MYSLPSASKRCEPSPRTIQGGSPPTARNARTGESTPPGITFSARCCSLRESSVLRGKEEIYHGGAMTRSAPTLRGEGHPALAQLHGAAEEGGGEQRRGESEVHERTSRGRGDADEIYIGRGVHR